MKILTLDESKWRCGRNSINSENRRGIGRTLLQNDEGFSCCLGQFSLQLNKEISESDILGCAQPKELYTDIPLLTLDDEESQLTEEAMYINDEEGTTVAEKIKNLKMLFAKEGYEIKVINQQN